MATPASVTPWSVATMSGDQGINALLIGTKWTSSMVTYSFPTYGSTWTTSYGDGEPWSANFSPLFSSDQAAIRTALSSWSAVANLTFVETSDTDTVVGDMRFAYTTTAAGADAQAWAYRPQDSSAAGDVWFSADSTSYTHEWSEGSYRYETAIHEIGHALGLKHPFSTSSYSGSLLYPSFDSRSFTIMSYSAVAGDDTTRFSYEPTTPMVLDIAAIQHLYGANTSTGAGNTSYVFNFFASARL